MPDSSPHISRDNAATVRYYLNIVAEEDAHAEAIAALDGLLEQVEAADEREKQLRIAWKANNDDLASQYREIVQGVEAERDGLKEQLEAGIAVVDLLLSQMSRGTAGVRDEQWYAARDVAENWLPVRRSNPASSPKEDA